MRLRPLAVVIVAVLMGWGGRQVVITLHVGEQDSAPPPPALLLQRTACYLYGIALVLSSYASYRCGPCRCGCAGAHGGGAVVRVGVGERGGRRGGRG